MIVGIQRVTHRDDASSASSPTEEDDSWRRLSDTNPFVRWLKRQLADDDYDGILGESLIDERDDDYADFIAEPYSEFTDYVNERESSTPRTLAEAEASSAAFVRLPARVRDRNTS
jgi:hypothetical protein